MNNTITLSQLITRLAASTGVDNNNARRFLRSFFATVEDALANGETVSIKGIGTFRAVCNDLTDGKMSVSYTPDEAIAKELNKPFEMFEAVVLADDIKYDDNDTDTTDNTIVLTDNLEVVDVSDKIETIDVSDRIETVADVDSVVEDTEKTAKQSVEEPEVDKVDVFAERVRTILWPEEEEEKDDEEDEEHSNPTLATPQGKPIIVKQTQTEEPIIENPAHSEEPNHKKLWIWSAIAVVAVSVIAYLAAVLTTPVDPISTDVNADRELAADTTSVTANTISEVTVDEVSTAKAEPVATTEPTTTPEDESQPTTVSQDKQKQPVYDTVEISLIRLAKKHYGESSYWVFIYEANRDIISNPNRIRPGQKVVIPDRSTFPGNSIAETKAIAKQKQSEILNKFK